jgi:hypothetical protein
MNSRSNTKPPWPRPVPDPQGADADQTAHAVADHRRDQGACCDSEQADLAERAPAGAQRTDDAITAVQGADEGALVTSIALDHVYSLQIGARLRANQGHDVRFRPLHPKQEFSCLTSFFLDVSAAVPREPG